MKNYTVTPAQPGWVAYFLDWDVDPDWSEGDEGHGLIPSDTLIKMDVAGFLVNEEEDDPHLPGKEISNVSALVRYREDDGTLIPANDPVECPDFMCLRGPNEAPPDPEEIAEAFGRHQRLEEAAERHRQKLNREHDEQEAER